MSVPLDRLYHFLKDVCNVDIIIYRWSPHGSRKLNDLKPISSLEFVDKFYVLTTQHMVCHDQEPLNYNLYSQEDFLSEIEKITQEELRTQLKNNIPETLWFRSDEFKAVLAKSHFRCLMTPISNVHDCVLLCHSEQNSKELEIFEQNGFIGVYYWSHALIARDWFRYAQYDVGLKYNSNRITSDFLIYNRAWSGTREYRLKFVDLLLDSGIANQCNIKFSAWDQESHYTNHNFVNPSLKINRQDIEHLLPNNTTDSCASADYETTDYATAGIEVVLETLFDDTRNHLTEKCLRPIACGRPFILAATPGSLEYLKSYGFKTFDGLINESYDKIMDPVHRLECIVEEMKRISTLDPDAKLSLWSELYKIAEENQKKFFSTQFHNNIVDEFKNNVKSAFDKGKTQITAKWFRLSTDPNLVAPNAIRNPAYAKRALEWAKQYNKDIDTNL